MHCMKELAKTFEGNTFALFLSMQRCFPFNQRPPFPALTLHRQRGECNKMRPIHPQPCVCTLRGSTPVHTSTEERLPWPQVLSVYQVIALVRVIVGRIVFPDDEIRTREKRKAHILDEDVGRIPVTAMSCVTKQLVGYNNWNRL